MSMDFIVILDPVAAGIPAQWPVWFGEDPEDGRIVWAEELPPGVWQKVLCHSTLPTHLQLPWLAFLLKMDDSGPVFSRLQSCCIIETRPLIAPLLWASPQAPLVYISKLCGSRTFSSECISRMPKLLCLSAVAACSNACHLIQTLRATTRTQKPARNG